ncbi:MAG: TIGR03905 family TSCPD domain-containing protein [Tissierellales bacterium]|jgi:uncharacterized protein (TIGR03905 family)|nr:TIGR03905 family TSCPD domain-containing protein [Tissierellales bacterium]
MKTTELRGVCAKLVNYDIIDGKLHNVSFVGGCNGNLKGITSLVEGMLVEDVIAKLEGITCGGKGTSCPDQFSKILLTSLNENSKAC